MLFVCYNKKEIFYAWGKVLKKENQKKKNDFGRKIFLSAPIHHHLEASGWPETKVTMRFWVIGSVAAFVGVLIALLGGHI